MHPEFKNMCVYDIGSTYTFHFLKYTMHTCSTYALSSWCLTPRTVGRRGRNAADVINRWTRRTGG